MAAGHPAQRLQLVEQQGRVLPEGADPAHAEEGVGLLLDGDEVQRLVAADVPGTDGHGVRIEGVRDGGVDLHLLVDGRGAVPLGEDRLRAHQPGALGTQPGAEPGDGHGGDVGLHRDPHAVAGHDRQVGVGQGLLALGGAPLQHLGEGGLHLRCRVDLQPAGAGVEGDERAGLDVGPGPGAGQHRHPAGPGDEHPVPERAPVPGDDPLDGTRVEGDRQGRVQLVDDEHPLPQRLRLGDLQQHPHDPFADRAHVLRPLLQVGVGQRLETGGDLVHGLLPGERRSLPRGDPPADVAEQLRVTQQGSVRLEHLRLPVAQVPARPCAQLVEGLQRLADRPVQPVLLLLLGAGHQVVGLRDRLVEHGRAHGSLEPRPGDTGLLAHRGGGRGGVGQGLGGAGLVAEGGGREPLDLPQHLLGALARRLDPQHVALPGAERRDTGQAQRVHRAGPGGHVADTDPGVGGSGGRRRHEPGGRPGVQAVLPGDRDLHGVPVAGLVGLLRRGRRRTRSIAQVGGLGVQPTPGLGGARGQVGPGAGGHRGGDESLDERCRADDDPGGDVGIDHLQRHLGGQHGTAEVHQDQHTGAPGRVVRPAERLGDGDGVGPGRLLVEPGGDLQGRSVVRAHLRREGDGGLRQGAAVRDDDQPDHRGRLTRGSSRRPR